jgi:LPXTG-motif cell wall-anchored protein
MSLRLARRSLVAAVVLMGVIAPSTARADLPPDYLPPNPGPLAVQPGEMGCFPLPGLSLGPDRFIGVEAGEFEQYQSIAEPPKADGSADAAVCVGLKDTSFIGIATFFVTLSSSRGASFTYELVLYIGVDLPATGTSTWVQAEWAAALLAAGAALLVFGRRRPRMVA